MKQIAIIHDDNYSDTDYVMSSIDYIARTDPKVFDGEFMFIIPPASTLGNLFKEANLPYEIAIHWPEEPKLLIGFSNWEESSNAYQVIMEQWRNNRPVYAFKVK